jgi:hypothetical protein
MKKIKRAIAMILALVTFSLFVIGSGDSGSSSSSGANPNDAGYYKKNGKWYYQGDGAN